MLNVFSGLKANLIFLKAQIAAPVVLATLAFAVLVVVMSLMDSYLGVPLEFDKHKINQGQIWRIVSGHFVHFGLYHTLMNLASVCLIGLCLFLTFPLRVWLGLLIFVPFMDGLGLYFLSQEIEIYRGYSGAVYGLAFVGLVLNWRLNPLIASIVIVGLWAKLIYERLPAYDPNFLIEKIGVPVAVDAHLWGGLTGVALSLPLWFYINKVIVKKSKNNVD